MERENNSRILIRTSKKTKNKPDKKDKPGSDSDLSWTTIKGSSFKGEEFWEVRYPRCNKPVKTWFQCKFCENMPTEEECLCCHKLDASQLFVLQG